MEPKLLEIKKLSFRYDDHGKEVLKNINMTIRPKEKIAIVGHNGAGKSTFVKLLLRLYQPTEGGIYKMLLVFLYPIDYQRLTWQIRFICLRMEV